MLATRPVDFRKGALGMTALDVGEVTNDIRRRDIERLDAQAEGGALAGAESPLVAPRPEPLVPPRKKTAENSA